MRIALIVEGNTEKVFLTSLRKFLREHLQERTPRIKSVNQKGRVPKGDELKKLVEQLLSEHDNVIALTDVHTGRKEFTEVPEFIDAQDAKDKMRKWVGENPNFYPHAAQHEFEAWLLPYWETIKELTGTNRHKPEGAPESVNHNRPPSAHIGEAFRTGTRKNSYSKIRDAARILDKNDLLIAANACPELKAFLNTVIDLSGGDRLPY